MKNRCPWLKLNNSNYVDYHDNEWGRPVREDSKHFELLTLEGAQAGLSWETILKKRDHYRKVFFNFDVKKVSTLSNEYLENLMQDPGIVRNRLKIYSVVSNAKNFIKIQKEFKSFNKYIWSFSENKVIYNSYRTTSDYPANTALSDQISKDLKKRGFKFVGSTIIYSYMQAAGIVQDHSVLCYLHKKKFR